MIDKNVHTDTYCHRLLRLLVSGSCVLTLWVVVVPLRATASTQVQLAEDVFLNVPDMGTAPVDEFMETMGMFASALGLNCADCHTFESSSSWAAYADETPIKRTTRRMIRMVEAINQQHFGGQPFVSCWTCHRGDLRPKVVPNLMVQYTAPADDPNEAMFIPDPFLPEPETIFDEYIDALGGEDALAGVTSFVAMGTYNGFDTGFVDVPVEIYAAAPGRATTIVHAPAGDSTRVYDGARGWIAATDRAIPLLPLTSDTLDGARIEATQFFPAGLFEERDRWVMTYTFIDDQEVRVIQGTSAGKTPLNLYFDDSGLLVRLLRFVDTQVGRIPTQIDYSDYREVAGIMMPFRWTSTWTNGQASVQLEGIQTDAPVDTAVFDQPAPAVFRE
jgi:photosynthetic reaction center cytochrome c subunit